jgi:hypothetical protein
MVDYQASQPCPDEVWTPDLVNQSNKLGIDWSHDLSGVLLVLAPSLEIGMTAKETPSLLDHLDVIVGGSNFVFSALPEYLTGSEGSRNRSRDLSQVIFREWIHGFVKATKMAKDSSTLAEAPVKSILVDLVSNHSFDNVATVDLAREKFETVDVSLNVAQGSCGQTTADTLFISNAFDTGAGETERSVNENVVWMISVLVHVDLVANVQDSHQIPAIEMIEKLMNVLPFVILVFIEEHWISIEKYGSWSVRDGEQLITSGLNPICSGSLLLGRVVFTEYLFPANSVQYGGHGDCSQPISPVFLSQYIFCGHDLA